MKILRNRWISWIPIILFIIFFLNAFRKFLVIRHSIDKHKKTTVAKIIDCYTCGRGGGCVKYTFTVGEVVYEESATVYRKFCEDVSWALENYMVEYSSENPHYNRIIIGNRLHYFNMRFSDLF